MREFVNLTGKVAVSSGDLAAAGSLLEAHRGRVDPRAIVALADSHRVNPQVVVSARVLAERGAPAAAEIVAAGELLLDEGRARVHALMRTLERFAIAARAADVGFVAVKGCAMRAFYPAGAERSMRDVDLVLESSGVWDGIRILERLGERTRRLRLESCFQDRIGRGVYGIAETEDNRFDLHLGAFPGCGGTPLEADIGQRAAEIELGATALPVTSLEDSVLVVAAHITREGQVLLRDLNDVYVAITAQPADGLDWDYVQHAGERNGLSLVIHALLEGVVRGYGLRLDPSVRQRFRQPRAGRVLSRVLVRPSDRDPALSFTPNKLFAGRFMQAAFLYRYHRPRHGRLRALASAAKGFVALVRHGRPYRLWSGRRRDPRRDERLVAVPLTVHPPDGREVWPISLEAAARHAFAHSVATMKPADTLVAWGAGSEDELLVTPYGFYAQTDYAGDLDDPTRRRLEASAKHLLADLSEPRGGLAP